MGGVQAIAALIFAGSRRAGSHRFQYFTASHLLWTVGLWLFACASAFAVGPPPTPELRLKAPASVSVDEADGSATFTAQLKIKSGTPDPFVIEVDYTTIGGSASEVDDFTPTSGTLIFTNHDLSQHISVPIIDDNVDEPDEQFTVSLGDPVIKSGNVDFTHDSFGVSTEVTIVDNDAPSGEIIFLNNILNVAEDIGRATVTLKRVNGSSGVISIDFNTADGSALAGSDYTAVAGTVVWGDGDTADKTIDVPIIDDGLVEPTENLTLDIVNPNSPYLYPTTASINILDNDKNGVIEFVQPNQIVDEDVGSVQLIVRRSGNGTGSATVDYTTADLTAAAGSDYVVTAGTLSWGDGELGDKVINISIVDDSIEEPNEGFSVSLANPTGQSDLGNNTQSTVTIIDNDEPSTLDFVDLTVTTNETGDIVTLTVTRSGNAAGAVTVDFATADGSATAGEDYTAVSGTLSWADGELGGKSVNVAILDDLEQEGDEDFTISLSNVTGPAELSANPTVTVVITDNDPAITGELEFNNTPLSVGEGAGVATISVSRVNGSSGQLEATYATTDNSATAGEDYSATSGSLIWADGESGAKTFNIPVTDDALVEDDETLTISVSNISVPGAAVVSEALTIIDNDDNGTLDFVDLNVTTNEAGDTVTLTVTRSGSGAGQVTVDFATADGTATAGEDYIATNGTLTWADGETGDRSVDVSIVDDVEQEGDEDFTITLSNITGPAELGANPTVTVVIVDNDPTVTGEIVFNDTPLSVNEAAGVATITLSRVNGSDGELEITYATADGTAVAGNDYTATSGSLVWSDGDSADKTFDIPITDDALAEGDETLEVNVSVSTQAGLSETLTIVDNDDGTLDFVDLNVTTNEAGDTVTLTVTRSGSGAGQVTVDFATADGSATAGEDYIAASGTLTWADGETGNRSVDVSIIDDNQQEGDEDFTISLDNVTGPATLGADSTVTVIITDNDQAANLEFLTSTVTTGEEAGTVTLTVTRTGSPPGALVIDFTTVDGSAIAPTDYQAVSGTLNWADGETGTRTIDIAITDDGVVEGDEVFTVNLVDRNNTTAPPVIAIVTIIDNDVNADLAFTDLNVTTNERGDAVTVSVTRSGNATGAVSVDFATQDGSATAGEDYGATSGTLSWLDGELGDRDITIPILDDDVEENDEDFSVILANITGQANLGANDTVTIVISASDGQREISVLPKLTPNQRRLANWFDKACPRLAASSNLSESQQELNRICLSIRNTDTTDEELCDALDAILPNELFVASFNALRLTAIQHGNLSTRINALRNGATGIDLAGLDIEINGEVIAGRDIENFVDRLLGGSAGEDTTWGRWGAFLDGRIVAGDKDRSEYEAGFDFDIYGFTAGVDYRIKQNFIVGGAVGWGKVDSDFQRNGGGIDIESVSGAAFLTYFNDSTFYVDALATWGRNDYESTRNIRFNSAGLSVQRKARGDTEGDQYSFGVGTGWDFSRGPLTYGPHLGSYYFNVAADAFNETGAGGLELRVDDQRSESLTTNVGGHVSYAFTTDWGVFVPNARFDWVKEFKDNRETLSFSFLHDPFANDPLAPSPDIKIETDRPDPSYFIWSVGVHAQLIYGISGFVDYKSFTSYDNVTLNEATWGFRWEKTW